MLEIIDIAMFLNFVMKYIKVTL